MQTLEGLEMMRSQSLVLQIGATSPEVADYPCPKKVSWGYSNNRAIRSSLSEWVVCLLFGHGG